MFEALFVCFPSYITPILDDPTSQQVFKVGPEQSSYEGGEVLLEVGGRVPKAETI